MSIAQKHGIKTGLQATGNYGRGLLKPAVSDEIVETLIPEVYTNQYFVGICIFKFGPFHLDKANIYKSRARLTFRMT